MTASPLHRPAAAADPAGADDAHRDAELARLREVRPTANPRRTRR